MVLTRTVATLALLGATVAGEAYVPIHKRFSYDVSINDFSYLGMLSKRDSCSDAFGPTAHNSNCAPDITLCCTRDGQDYPSCEKWLKKGWCCVGGGDEDKCYVDQASVCDEDSSVACTKLANGTTKACCPKLTTCDESLEASEGLVRCNINRGDLMIADAGANGKTSTTTKVSSKKSASPTTLSPVTVTAPVAETTSTTPSDDSTTISGGAIGGIVVGAVAGVAGIAGLLYWLFRRNRKSKYEAANQTPPQPSIQQYYQEQHVKYGEQPQGYYPGSDQNSAFAYSGSHPNQQLPSPPPAELMEQRRPVELDSTARS